MTDYTLDSWDSDESAPDLNNPTTSTPAKWQPIDIEAVVNATVEVTDDMLPPDPEVDILNSKIEEISKRLAEFAAAISEPQEFLNSYKDEATKIREEANEKIRQLNDRARGINELIFDTKKDMRALESEIESAKRQRDQINRAKVKRAELATLEERWEAMLAGAPWLKDIKPHQAEGARKLTYYGRMILADTMGLGKTFTSLATCDYVRAATKYASDNSPVEMSGLSQQGISITRECGLRVLYVCPSALLTNVVREARHWAPHRSVVLMGGQDKVTRRFLIEHLQDMDEFIVVINYEAWRKDNSLIDDLSILPFDVAIIDEAHNVKDRNSNAYRGLRKILDGTVSSERITECVNSTGFYNPRGPIPFVFPMTGTPILNRPQEFYSLLTLVDPVHFRNEKSNVNYFLWDYCEQYDSNKWKFKAGGLDRLQHRISNLYMRRTKEQAGIMLPPKTINIHDIEVDHDRYPGQSEAREQMRNWGSIVLDPENGKSISAMAEIAVYTRLRQVEVWPAGIKAEVKDSDGNIIASVSLNDEPKFRQSQKCDYIIDIESDEHPVGLLPEVVTDERVVVFSQFKSPLHELQSRCEKAGIRSVILDGDTPEKLREEIKIDLDAKYTTRGEHKYDVVFANYKVGSIGLNFTGASQVIVLDEEWNPGKRDQAYDRLHRMGQELPVTIHVLRDRKTIDDWMSNLIAQKEELVEGFDSSYESFKGSAWDAIQKGEM